VIENVSSALKKYLEGKPYLSALLSFAAIILYVTVGIMLFNSFVYLGGFISGLLEYVFYLAIVLCLANADFQALMIGLGVRSIVAIVNLCQALFDDYLNFFSWSSFFAILVYGFFAYMAYTKTVRKA